MKKLLLGIIILLIISFMAAGCLSGLHIDLNSPHAATLYRIKPEGNSREKVINRDVSSVVGINQDWIYYVRFDDRKIYRVGIDGRKKTKLSDDFVAGMVEGLPALVDDWIYYAAVGKNKDIADMKLMRIKTDGTGREQLDDEYSGLYQIVDNWIYFLNWDDRGNIYRIRTDGKDRIKITDITTEAGQEETKGTGESIPPGRTGGIGSYAAAGEWVYYYDSYYDKLFKTQGIAEVPAVVRNGQCSVSAVIDDWIYYFDYEQRGLFRIKEDSSDPEKITGQIGKEPTWRSTFIIEDNALYFQGFGESDKESGFLGKIDLDNMQATQLVDDPGLYLTVSDNWVYYSSGLTLSRIRTDGSGQMAILTGGTVPRPYWVSDGWIYYFDY